MSDHYTRVLSIAGSDCSGGAGIQADIKTLHSLGCYAATAISAVVDEDTAAVHATLVVPVEMLVAQINTVLDDIGADAVKTGMLPTARHVEAVADLCAGRGVANLVVDPVMVATSGDPLQQDGALAALRGRLIPRARVVTPNIPEAEALLAHPIAGPADLRDAAAELAQLGASVLLKGGHFDHGPLIDVLCNIETRELLELPADRVDTPNTHGTGCTLSSALAAYLALGRPLTPAVVAAKQYMQGAIVAGAKFQIGHKHGPVCHFWQSL